MSNELASPTMLAFSRSGGDEALERLSPVPSPEGNGIDDVRVESVLENDLPLLNKTLDETSNWAGKYTRHKCSTPSRSLYKCPEKKDLQGFQFFHGRKPRLPRPINRKSNVGADSDKSADDETDQPEFLTVIQSDGSVENPSKKSRMKMKTISAALLNDWKDQLANNAYVQCPWKECARIFVTLDRVTEHYKTCPGPLEKLSSATKVRSPGKRPGSGSRKAKKTGEEMNEENGDEGEATENRYEDDEEDATSASSISAEVVTDVDDVETGDVAATISPASIAATSAFSATGDVTLTGAGKENPVSKIDLDWIEDCDSDRAPSVGSMQHTVSITNKLAYAGTL